MTVRQVLDSVELLVGRVGSTVRYSERGHGKLFQKAPSSGQEGMLSCKIRGSAMSSSVHVADLMASSCSNLERSTSKMDTTMIAINQGRRTQLALEIQGECVKEEGDMVSKCTHVCIVHMASFIDCGLGDSWNHGDLGTLEPCSVTVTVCAASVRQWLFQVVA